MWISMTVFVGRDQPDRAKWFERSIESFLSTDFPHDTHVLISDDCSDHPIVDPILKQVEREKVPNLEVLVMHRYPKMTCDPNMIDTMRRCLAYSMNHKWVVTTDSDVLYNPRWLKKLVEAHSSMDPAVRDKMALLTCFNAVSISDHKVIGKVNDLVIEKNHCGGFCSIVPRRCLEHPQLQVAGWDWSLTDIARREKWRYFCTSKSWVQHLGPGKSGTYDKAEDFVGEDYDGE